MRSVEERLGELLRYHHLTMATAESCTGGNIAGRITAIPGSSEYFKGAVVAYSNEIKVKVLGVSPETLKRHGAVSEETVREMLTGVVRLMDVDCAVATSGIAGPGGGTPFKPVGTIWLGAIVHGEIVTCKLNKDSGREQNVANAVKKVMELLMTRLK